MSFLFETSWQVDHDKIEYKAFRKNLYVQAQLWPARHSTAEASSFRIINMQVKEITNMKDHEAATQAAQKGTPTSTAWLLHHGGS